MTVADDLKWMDAQVERLYGADPVPLREKARELLRLARDRWYHPEGLPPPSSPLPESTAPTAPPGGAEPTGEHRLLDPEYRELGRLNLAPQASSGSARGRIHGKLVGLGLARYVDRQGAVVERRVKAEGCEITREGRSVFLVENDRRAKAVREAFAADAAKEPT